MKLEPIQTYQLDVVYRMDGGPEGINTLSYNVFDGEFDNFAAQHEADRTVQFNTVTGAAVSLLVDRIIYAQVHPVVVDATE